MRKNLYLSELSATGAQIIEVNPPVNVHPKNIFEHKPPISGSVTKVVGNITIITRHHGRGKATNPTSTNKLPKP